MFEIRFFKDTDNERDLMLESPKGTPADLSSLTRVVVNIDNTSDIDSAVFGAGFDWSIGNGVLRLKLGQSGLEIGKHTARVQIFSPTYPNGLVWGEAFIIKMVDI